MDQNLPDAGLPTSAPGPARAQHRADVAPGSTVMPGPAGTGEAEREAALKRMKLVAT